MVRIFLACTPRAGNVWFRRLLGNILDAPIFIGHNPGQIPWTGLPDECIVAMHWHYNPWFASFLDRLAFQRVCLLRHPLDVLVSILRFAPREPATAKWLEGECGDERTLADATPISPAFVDYCLSPRAATLLNVSPGWANFCRAVTRYEDLIENASSELRRFISELGVEPKRNIEDVVAAESIDKLRPLAPHHFWQGRMGLWEDLFTADLAQRVHQVLEPVFKIGGYKHQHREEAAPSQEQIASAWAQLAAE